MDRIKKLQRSPWLLRKRFDEVDELAETGRAWDIDFRQLRPGFFDGTLEQAMAGDVLLSVGHFNRALDQAGTPPPGRRTVAIPLDPGQRFHWRGHEIHGGQIAVFPFGGELRAVSRAGFHVATVSLPDGRIDDSLENGTEVVTPTATAMARLRGHVLGLRVNMTPEGLADDLAEILVEALESADERRGPPTIRARDRALRRVDEYVGSRPREPITVRELCRVAGVSHRTLAYAFRERYGMTAKAWLRNRRLTGVRRELRRADPEVTKIADLANRWGFWHLGQFAADYRRQFGELPSATLTRTRA